MAARPFLFLTDKMIKRIMNTIDDEFIRDWENPK
jgi:phage gpG-like protein